MIKTVFSKLKLKSPISRQDFSYDLTVNKANGKENFEKKIKSSFETIIYDLDGFNQDGYDRKRFERNGFNMNGIDENGFNSNN